MKTILKIVDTLKRHIIASAILKEAARLAGENRRIPPGLLEVATDEYVNVLLEIQKKGL